MAGTTFPIDRQYIADQLGFERIYSNSLDAVRDRDFASAASLIMVHLSRLAEEIIFWASEEFRFVTLTDSCSTESSTMSQKPPDVPELVRSKLWPITKTYRRIKKPFLTPSRRYKVTCRP